MSRPKSEADWKAEVAERCRNPQHDATAGTEAVYRFIGLGRTFPGRRQYTSGGGDG